MNKLSKISRLALGLSCVLLIASLFVPIWRIELDAPQYPEGLMLQIWASKIAGDVDVINGLNHYIGMKTLHTEDFIEFTVLPYIILAYAAFFLVAAVIGTKKWLNVSFWAFAAFGVIAMADFWKWEYDYGHHLDPNAAIKVPGMAYQPPLIGFKQLLNFGAFSVPDLGGWLLLIAGLLLLAAVLGGRKGLRKRSSSLAAVAGVMFFFSSCNAGPEPIRVHKDACAYCRMAISDGRFGAELITRKGRVYKFDDIVCMLAYNKEMDQGSVKQYFIHDYEKDNVLTEATAAWYVHHESLKSPMTGNTAAFASKEQAEAYASGVGAQVDDWPALIANSLKDR